MRELTMLVRNCEFSDVVCDVLLLLEFEWEPAEPGWAQCPPQGACVADLAVTVLSIRPLGQLVVVPLPPVAPIQAEIDRRLPEPGSRLRERIERYIAESMADARDECRYASEED